VKRQTLFVSFLVLGLAVSDAPGAIISVPGDFGTIQGAIDAAGVTGDEIIVAPGAYHEVLNFNGKAINLHSASGNPVDTIIDGAGLNNSVVQCVSGEGAGTILEGFTITGGMGNMDIFSSPAGGGMINNGTNPIVSHCIFSGNTANNGGGMHNSFGSNPTVTNCAFNGNTVSSSNTSSGGGIYNFNNSNPTVTNCTFLENTATWNGGGMFNSFNSSPSVTSCAFRWNTAGIGGGMYSTSFSSPSVIDCIFSSNSARGGGGMYNFNNSNSIIDNCTFRLNSASFNGGGMGNSNSSPTITDCTFSKNWVDDGGFFPGGGGMNNSFSSNPSVTNCIFSGNTVTNDGGGMYNFTSSSPTISDCTFSGNTAEAGGGINNFDNCSPILIDCTFIGNTADAGGGMLNSSSSTPTVTNCIFNGNSATFGVGGGMYNRTFSSSTILNCIFKGNSANFRGGGMYNSNGSSPTVNNCTFSRNSATQDGGGMLNTDSGTFGGSNPIVTNCILWGDTPNEMVNNNSSTPTISFSNILGGVGIGSNDGGGNIHVNPLFIDADGPDNIPGTLDDDFRLQSVSPCIDAGDNTTVPVDITTDLDGAPRFVDNPTTPDTGFGTPPVVDMGAYEFQVGLVALLDIEPGECPNEFEPRLGDDDERIKIALVGTAEFAVDEVDVSTLLLGRADGVGGSVLPDRVKVKDLATPFGGDSCGCHELEEDGVDDLRMKFLVGAMTVDLELDLLPEGTVVELVLSGAMLNGTEFSARDCMVIGEVHDDEDDEDDDHGNGESGSLVGDAHPTKARSPRRTPPCRVDVNGDGIVNIDDFILVMHASGRSSRVGRSAGRGDVTSDGVVNIDDLVAVLNGFGGV